MDNSTYTIRAGDDVYGSDRKKVGRVVAVERDYLVVGKGRFLPTDYYIPLNAVASYKGGRIALKVTRANVLDQGWDRARVLVSDGTTSSTVPHATAPTDTDAAGLEMASRETGRGMRSTGFTMTADSLRMPIHEEELVANKTTRSVAGTRIEKIVAVENHSLDLSAAELRLKVVRRRASGPADAAHGDTYEEVLIDVPLDIETFDVVNGARVGSEIVIMKELVQHTERALGTVLREEIHVSDATEGSLGDADRSR